MQSVREHPDSEENQLASKQNEREIFALQMQARQKRELSTSDKHLLRLVRKGRNTEGWAPVSAMLLPLVQQLPPELVTVESGHVKLTEAGETVLDWI